jgi:DivIVA domain-containing protein
MADPLSPDSIAQRTFGQRLRGYNPDEVRAFLEEVALSVRELKSRSDALHTRLLELGNRDLTAEFDLISHDVGRILQDAREAAEGMRKRAAGDAETLLEEAQTTAFGLRSDSWMVSEKLLQDSTKESAAIVQAAERDSLVIIGEAEREAHRRQSAARQESEETVRAAKLEGERVLMDARSRSDELMAEASRKVAAAEARAAGVEERRTEMLADLENARQMISNLEGEIEKRREALAGPSPEEVESSTVKLLTSPDRETTDVASGTMWAEGHEVVKIVRPPKRIVDPPTEPVDAEAMAAEVARLRSPAAEDDEPAVESEAPPEGSLEPTEAPPEESLEPTGAAELEEAATIQSPTTEIDDLFARLRRVEEETPPSVPAAPETVASTPDGTIEADLPPRPGSAPAEAGVPFDRRDRLLLPVTNRVLRAVKRELTEAQNIALEELRVEAGNWEPDAATLADRLVGSVGELLADGYSGGWSAAAEVSESDLVFDGDRQGDPAEWAGRFAAALTAAVSEALAESHRDGHGPRQLAASLSRVYRSWRTGEAERRVRDIASGAYHRGLIDGFGSTGLAASRWVVSGRGCTICREAAEAGAVPLGSAFEDSVTEPPAHNDCGCTLVPA